MGLFDVFKGIQQSNGIPLERMPEGNVKPVTEPIEGYTLKYHYKNVEVSSWDRIPRDVKIGNRVAFIQEKNNEADKNAVLLMFVPQRKRFGYLFKGKMQDMVNDYLNRGDKVVARLSHLS